MHYPVPARIEIGRGVAKFAPAKLHKMDKGVYAGLRDVLMVFEIEGTVENLIWPSSLGAPMLQKMLKRIMPRFGYVWI